MNKGIEWLDVNAPADWRSKINFDTLNLRSWGNCILGQVFGKQIPSTVLKLPLEEYGFNAHNLDNHKELVALWKEAVLNITKIK